LNAPPDAPELEPLLKGVHDAWPTGSGAGFTYPADNPVKRTDYVLTSPQFSVRSASVPVMEASDHRPVVVDLVLR
jgi:endonuclease/exonuclease/phosphatase family metal-dependent hydrolase